MPSRRSETDIAGRIRAKRETAAQARRLVTGLSVEPDHQRILEFADQLEREADELERTAP